MTMPCAVSIDERRHQQDCEEADRRADAVSDFALELVCGELSIVRRENFDSALAEAIEDEDLLRPLHRALTDGHLNVAAHTLRQAIDRILVARADSQAEAYVANACQKCYGRGCLKCDPPEPDYDD